MVGTYGARAFELTREHEVVWEYVSPHRAPDELSFAARLHDVTRLPEGFGAGWLGDPDSR